MLSGAALSGPTFAHMMAAVDADGAARVRQLWTTRDIDNWGTTLYALTVTRTAFAARHQEFIARMLAVDSMLVELFSSANAPQHGELLQSKLADITLPAAQQILALVADLQRSEVCAWSQNAVVAVRVWSFVQHLARF